MKKVILKQTYMQDLLVSSQQPKQNLVIILFLFVSMTVSDLPDSFDSLQMS